MRVLIPLNKDFDFKKCEKLYLLNQSLLNDESSFHEVIKNTFFYSFYEGKELTLCVYYYEKGGKLWVNGYGIRKKHLYNKNCFIKSLSWFNCDIWAFTPHREVAFALLRCGFKKIKDNVYMYKNSK